MTGDVAVLKILASAIYENRVLPAKKAAVTKYDSVTFDTNGERLPDRASRVYEGNVLNREIVGIDECRRRAKCPNRFAVRTNHVGVEVVSNNCLRRVFADEMYESLLVLDINQFPVDAGF